MEKLIDAAYATVKKSKHRSAKLCISTAIKCRVKISDFAPGCVQRILCGAGNFINVSYITKIKSAAMSPDDIESY